MVVDDNASMSAKLIWIYLRAYLVLCAIVHVPRWVSQGVVC